MPAEPVVLPLPAELPREAAESLRATLLGHPRGATVVLDWWDGQDAGGPETTSAPSSTAMSSSNHST